MENEMEAKVSQRLCKGFCHLQVNSLSQWPELIKFRLYYRDLNRKPKKLKVLLLAKEVKQGFGGDCTMAVEGL